jgi:CubicO group peptidase (beta-lactamase class C family)
MTKGFVVALGLALASPRLAAAADDLPARIDAVVREVLADQPSAGAAVEVLRKGRVVVAKGYGKANVELDVPMTERNVFRIGSITKQFTAAAILRLVESGKLKLDDDVGKLLPDAPLHGKHVTVAQLLTHTSGLKNYTELPETMKPLPLPPARLFALLKDQPFGFEPGQSWRYSNTNYYLLGLIIEKLGGRSYRDFLRDEVLARAGLKHTLYCDNDAIIADRAEGYAGDAKRLKNAGPIDMSAPFAAGALCSTVADLVAWSQALAGGKVVSPASYALMTTPVKTTDGKAPPYGFGLALGDRDGHRKVGHNGGIPGFASALVSFPDDELIVAVLANTQGDVAQTAAARIVGVALGLPEPPKAKRLPLPDPARFVGTFRLTDEGMLHVLHTYAESGQLWVYDEADGDTDRLDYQGGDEFLVAHKLLRVRITSQSLDTTLPDGRTLPAPRQK